MGTCRRAARLRVFVGSRATSRPGFHNHRTVRERNHAGSTHISSAVPVVRRGLGQRGAARGLRPTSHAASSNLRAGLEAGRSSKAGRAGRRHYHRTSRRRCSHHGTGRWGSGLDRAGLEAGRRCRRRDAEAGRGADHGAPEPDPDLRPAPVDRHLAVPEPPLQHARPLDHPTGWQHEGRARAGDRVEARREHGHLQAPTGREVPRRKRLERRCREVQPGAHERQQVPGAGVRVRDHLDRGCRSVHGQAEPGGAAGLAPEQPVAGRRWPALHDLKGEAPRAPRSPRSSFGRPSRMRSIAKRRRRCSARGSAIRSTGS